MKIGKSPSLPFYGKQFYDDERVWLSSLAHQGLYIALLWHQWAEGSIPADVALVARLVGQRETDVRKLWSEVSPHFSPHPELAGRLVNETLEDIRRQMVDKRNKRGAAGSKGGSKSQANRKANAQANEYPPNGDGEGFGYLFGEEGCGEEIADAAFESCWLEYPRKLGKDAARRHFDAQVETSADLEALRSAIVNYRRELGILNRGDEHTLHGSTFFNARWRDYVDGVWTAPKSSAPKSATPAMRTVAAAAISPEVQALIDRQKVAK